MNFFIHKSLNKFAKSLILWTSGQERNATSVIFVSAQKLHRWFQLQEWLPGMLYKEKWKLYESLYFGWTLFQYDSPTSDQWQVSDNANTALKTSTCFSTDFHWMCSWVVSKQCTFGEPSTAITVSTATQTLRDIWPQIKLYSVYL